MFNNNTVINELYNKINEHKNLKEIFDKRRMSFYAMVAIISIAATCLFATEKNSNIIISFTMAILLFSMFGIVCITHNVEAYPFIWKKSDKALDQKEQQILDYLEQDSIQIEILNFEFKDSSETRINNLKIFLASKEYYDAYDLLYCMLNNEINFEENQIIESHRQKLIAEYELSLKMKI